jgi:sulfonate transport system substrate-binding protein
MADTPVIFGQAAGDKIKIVAVDHPENPAKQSNYVVVVPTNSSITSVKQLKGKSIGVTTGTVLEYIAVGVLAKAGIKYSQITPVSLTTAASAALANGSIQADVTSLLEADSMIAAGGTKILTTGAGVNFSPNYLVASQSALDNPQKAAAIADFIGRMAKAQAWAIAHPAQWGPVYAKGYGLPATLGDEVVKQLPEPFAPITPALEAAQQKEATFFHEEGIVPEALNTKQEFDTSYNKDVTATLAAATS